MDAVSRRRGDGCRTSGWSRARCGSVDSADLARHRGDRLRHTRRDHDRVRRVVPGDEAEWEAAPEERRQATYAQHHEFAKLLEERGHRVTGGAELAHSREAKLLRTAPTATNVTDGPFAETVEQLTGFYLIDTADLDDLLEVCKVSARARASSRSGEIEGRVVVMKFLVLMAEEDT